MTGHPTARKQVVPAAPTRVVDQLKGRIRIAPDFDAPDPESKDLFYTGPVCPPEDPA